MHVTESVPPPIPTIRAKDLKPDTWYFGIACRACGEFLVVVEDWLELHRSGVSVLDLYRQIAVNCQCGAQTRTKHLQQFRTGP